VLLAQYLRLAIVVLIPTETLTTIALVLLDFTMQELTNVLPAIQAVFHARMAQLALLVMP
jgi:hypothetical protein